MPSKGPPGLVDGPCEYMGTMRGRFRGGYSSAEHEDRQKGRWRIENGDLLLDRKNNGKFHPVHISAQKDDQGNPELVPGRERFGAGEGT